MAVRNLTNQRACLKHRFENSIRKTGPFSKSNLSKNNAEYFHISIFVLSLKFDWTDFLHWLCRKCFAVCWPLKCCVIRSPTGQTRSSTLSATSKFELNSFQHGLYNMTFCTPYTASFSILIYIKDTPLIWDFGQKSFHWLILGQRVQKWCPKKSMM